MGMRMGAVMMLDHDVVGVAWRPIEQWAIEEGGH